MISDCYTNPAGLSFIEGWSENGPVFILTFW